MKAAVIYYSLTGNTEFLAKNIAEEIEADLIRLKPKDDLDQSSRWKYLRGMKQVLFKQEPELMPLEWNPKKYEMLLIGTPVWFGRFVPAFNTFFSSLDLENKQIALYCSHRGGPGSSLRKMESQLEEDNNILDKKAFDQPLEKKERGRTEAKNWVNQLLDSPNNYD